MEDTTCIVEFRALLSAYQNPNVKKLAKMIFYRYRLETFTSWPFSSSNGDRCTPENMAAAGFYSISRKKDDTSVKCFCCLKELDGWEGADDPWEEHTTHQTKCSFIKLNQMEPEWTLENYIDMHQSLTVNSLEENLSLELENLEYELNIKQNSLQKEKRKKKKR